MVPYHHRLRHILARRLHHSHLNFGLQSFEQRRQQQLKAQYGIDRPDVVVVERKNVFVITLRVILHAAYIALRICASCAVAVLAIIGLASLIYPNIRAELVNSLGQVMDELQAFLA